MIRRRCKRYLGLLLPLLAATTFSCTTMLGGSLRDAAIKAAAGFVEGATGDLLNGMFSTGQSTP